MKQKLLILLAALLASVSVHGYDFEVDGIYYCILNYSSRVEVTSNNQYSGTDYSGDIIIPATVLYDGRTYTVTSIGDAAFYYCSSLTSVVIPNSVTSIGYMAFYNCTSLKPVTIPNSVISIGAQAFSLCDGLTTVEIPNSVTSIGNEAFYGCSGLASVNLPSSVISIGSSAFKCTPLFSDGTNWENGAFYINNHLLSTKSDLINGNYAIKNGTLTIAGGAFLECSSLNSVTIPNSVVSIGVGAFSRCKSLNAVEIGNSVTSIDNFAFAFCSGLTSVTIPNSVTSIGYDAFYSCSGLTSLVIPNSVTSIRSGAFSNCISLTELTLNNINPLNISLDRLVFENCSVGSATLYVPAGSKELYAAADQWKEFGTIEEFQPAINFVDGEPYSGNEDLQGVDVTYIRNFPSADWQALFVPFDMSYEEWSPYAKVAELSGVHEYDLDDDGVIERTTIEFTTVTKGKIKPNVPYVIKAFESGETVFNCKDKTVKSCTQCETIDTSSPRWQYAFTGIYEPRSDLGGCYGMSARGNSFIQIADGQTLKPNRFYMEIIKRNGGYWEAPSRNKLPQEIYIEVDGELCGIIDVESGTYYGTGDSYYDIFGRKIQNPTNGLYIQNGKKIYIK